MALSYRTRAQMMAGYHHKVAPAERIRNIEGVLVLQLKNGALVVLAPVDFVFWTRRLENKVKTFETAVGKMGGISGKEIWITGKFEKAARENFERNGRKVFDNAAEKLYQK